MERYDGDGILSFISITFCQLLLAMAQLRAVPALLIQCFNEQRCALFYGTVRPPRGWDRIL